MEPDRQDDLLRSTPLPAPSVVRQTVAWAGPRLRSAAQSAPQAPPRAARALAMAPLRLAQSLAARARWAATHDAPASLRWPEPGLGRLGAMYQFPARLREPLPALERLIPLYLGVVVDGRSGARSTQCRSSGPCGPWCANDWRSSDRTGGRFSLVQRCSCLRPSCYRRYTSDPCAGAAVFRNPHPFKLMGTCRDLSAR